ncbi:MAG: FadR family transcriptional regulator [Alphaproteobacteria bacterium]|nr:FadR family transcriptional regulator [Alphaproteobacteria bacterium]
MTTKAAARRAGEPFVSDRIAQELLSLIAEGRLVPGQRLPGERQLAEDMGASRVSVRAALQRLKTQGFLAAVQGGGTRVIASDQSLDPPLTELVRHNLENLHDLLDIRTALEVWAARRAARNRDDSDLAAMEALVLRMEACASTAKSDDDVQFHLAIAKASGSSVYALICTVIRDVLSEMVAYHRYQLFSDPSDDFELGRQHRAILEGIRSGREDEAAAAMSAHLGWVMERYDDARRRQSA